MQRVFYLKEMKIKFLFGFFLMALSSFAFGQKIMGLSFVGTKEKVLAEQIIPVQEVGANWVTLMPFGYMQSVADSMLRYDTSWQWEGEKTKGLHATIPLFKAKGIIAIKHKNIIQKCRRWPLRLYYLSLCLNLGGRADLFGNGFQIMQQLEEKIIWDLRHKIN